MTPLTLNDVRLYIIKIQLNFENAYRFETDEELNLLLVCWMDILGNYPKEVCDAAVNNALAKAKFAPRLGDIVDEIKALSRADSKTDQELWAELMDIKFEVWENSKYLRYPQHYEEANKKLEKIYENLDKDLKLYVVNLSTLLEIAQLSDEELVYEKNRFFKNMPALRKHSEDKIMATAFLKLIDQNKALTDKKTSDEQ